MPLDFKRFNGPDDSVGYNRFTPDYIKTYEELYKELFDKNGKRKDGRELNEARNMFATADSVSQAKGSSYVELDKTKVICSVFDPREIPHQSEFSHYGQIYCEVKFAPFSCPRKRRPHAPDLEEKALSVALKQALESTVCTHLFPNFQIDIFIYILVNDGSCLAAAVTAAGIALANAAVPVYDILTSASLAIIDDKIFIDPTEAEEHLALMSTDKNTNHGVITMSTLPVLEQVVDFHQIGSLDGPCVLKAMDLLKEHFEKMLQDIQKVLVLNIQHQLKEQKRLEGEMKEREELLNSKLKVWKEQLQAK